MKNKLIIILILLSLPISVLAVDENLIPMEEPTFIEQTTESAEELHSQEIEDIQSVTQKAEEQSVKSETNVLPHKKPISKKTLLKKFLLAMFLVGISSVILYFGKILYNKTGDNISVQIKTPDGKTPLSEPDGLESAVDIFLDKTKWV